MIIAKSYCKWAAKPIERKKTFSISRTRHKYSFTLKNYTIHVYPYILFHGMMQLFSYQIIFLFGV